LDQETEQLVDVANVSRGGECGCICPSCKTPLIARQGDIKEWHFAHRTRNVHQDTKNECEYSFNVSVRLMIRQLAMQSLNFRAPKYAGYLEAHSKISLQSHRADFVVTEESVIVLSDLEIGVSFSHTAVDILGYVN
jgi:competence CoiA-like predicted nuclease